MNKKIVLIILALIVFNIFSGYVYYQEVKDIKLYKDSYYKYDIETLQELEWSYVEWTGPQLMNYSGYTIPTKWCKYYVRVND